MKRIALSLTLIALSASVSANQTFALADYNVPSSGRVVAPAISGDSLGDAAEALDSVSGGAVMRAVAEAGFSAESGETLTLFGIAPFSRIDLIGIGDQTPTRASAENFGGTAAALLGDTTGGSVQLLWPPELQTADASGAEVAFGYRLRSYRFDRLQSERVDPNQRPAVVVLSDEQAGERYHNDLAHMATGVFFARDVSSEPGNRLWPQAFVDRARTLFKGLRNIRISVLDEGDLQRLGMGAHWGVGKGSTRPPRLLIIEYNGGGDTAPVVLAGKGITFDTGGISLKRNPGMWAMKGDLGGAGVVVGTIYAAAKREANTNIVALAAMAENMPSGSAIRPGDVLTTMSGKTVEILSTDAEGRLVLADAVHYAQQTYEPAILINVATLTGAVGQALGDDYAGIFGRHDNLIDDLSAASTAANEAVWRLPLDATHFAQLESNFADIKNSGTGNPGASTAAAFIGAFISEELPWAHLDIAGVDMIEEDRPTVPSGFTGWGVRTLDEYLRRHHESR